MRQSLLFSVFLLGLLCLPSNAIAAPKKYFWGETYGQQGIAFHRQSNNISNFESTITLGCEFTDGTTDQVEAFISGPEVPNLLIRRNRVEAQFSAYIEGLMTEGEVSISGQFRGNKAVFSVVVTSEFSDGSCSGGIVFSDIRRGARVR